jgi:hypothetical protein
MDAMEPSFLGRRKSWAFLANERMAARDGSDPSLPEARSTLWSQFD